MSSQYDNVDVSEEVKQVVSDVIAKNNLKKTCEIKYYPGSQAGDGYTTKTYIVDIEDDETSISLFLKCALNIEKNIPFADMIYANETFFYKMIYPTYKELLESKGVKDGFAQVPRCYGYNETKGSEIIALANLRKEGFTLFDKNTCMNDEHLKLTLRSFAKFHAVSFVLKDQRKALHDEFCERCPNIAELLPDVPKMMSNTTNAFTQKLDAVTDKDILDRCDNLDLKISDQYANMNKNLSEYSIITKGDCWINNMMILYENDHPKDVMLIDWQGVTLSSPIHDFQGLFYSVASEEAVDNYKYYLQVYHEELSKRIEELGSDPEILYPRSVFEKEWIDYGLFALGECLVGIKMMLCESKNVPTLEKDDIVDMFSNVVHDEVEYLRRAKYVVRHMIDIGVF